MLRSNREGPIGITDEQKKPGIGWKLDKMRKRAPIECIEGKIVERFWLFLKVVMALRGLTSCKDIFPSQGAKRLN